MLVEEASAVLSVLQAHPFDALHYPFQRQSSVTLSYPKKNSTEKLLSGKRKDEAEGSPERQAAPNL